MFKVCVCDDRQAEAIRLIALIRDYFQSERLEFGIDAYDGGEALLDALRRGKGYDIYFLDIVMPGMDGLELARAIREHTERAVIVFVTSSEDYALDGYRVSAMDYLLKPLDPAALRRAMDKIIGRITSSGTLVVRLSTRNGFVQLDTRRIIYAESSGHYVTFHLAGESPMRVHGSLSDFSDVLTRYRCFVRCHKSYIVNMNHVHALQDNCFELADGRRVNISRQYQPSCKGTYVDYIVEGMTFGN